MKSFLKPSRGGPKIKNNDLLLEFIQLKKSLNFSEEDNADLSIILAYYATTMLIAIENNIKLHFGEYVRRYVNSYFYNLHKDDFNNPNNISKINAVNKKIFNSELNILKKDILNNTTLCDKKYHNWLKENRFKIVPEICDEISYIYESHSNPQKYLKYMIFMNTELEKIEGKMFQFFPLQTQIIPKHIQIDTISLIRLFIPYKDQKYFIDDLDLHKEELWKQFFNLKIYSKKYSKRSSTKVYSNKYPINYFFDYTIITDGFSTSLRFIHKDFLKQQETKKMNLRKGRMELNGLSKEEKDIKREEKKKKRQEKEKAYKKLRLEALKAKKEEEKNELSEKQEFDYIDDDHISNDDLEGPHAFIDPGKYNLFTMMNDEEVFFTYTNRKRLIETKRLKYQRLIKNFRDKLKITDIEKELSLYNAKTCNLEKFKKYVIKKLEINEQLYDLYQEKKFRQYKFYAYINRTRSEDNLLNTIEKIYSKDGIKPIIIIGDWSIGKQMRSIISTPNIALKRKLKERFKVYNIDEFRTSCLHYKTEKKCKNLYLKDLKGVSRKKHSILTFKMENKRTGCINRDRNGCKNMKKIFNHYIKTGERLERYRRGYKLEDSEEQTCNEDEDVFDEEF